MAQFDESIRGQIQALLRVMSLTRCVNEDKVPCKIEEGLFLGSVGAANNKGALKHLNVTHILTVASTLRPAYPDDFVYKVLTVTDREDTNIREYFDECIEFIDEAKRLGGGVLVHCFVGKSRSVTIVVAYLMKKHGMSLSQALEHVKSRRPQASPNSGFIAQLQDYEKFLRGV
ncbi:dual specificity protein phosphatase 1-like [Rhodamnia argentea]|uniref:Dual specificity protein phosphatase 1-like n=1 Tax=Rhodamnia argentea TaxID=178133 RepID=A0A8B8PN09_9MYRT|nr:dual specificity protein phosphatase 1-like [Rhodamnia argentea]XP_030515623.1 dual specificity protein phosphatase 1-like [Rhodamnia argentea]XP_048137106.1 dual specificity protein phosphatase 1-like [Rhodamnia argentea]